MLAQLEKVEQDLEDNKSHLEHDGMSMRGEEDPEVLHPQSHEVGKINKVFSPLAVQAKLEEQKQQESPNAIE